MALPAQPRKNRKLELLRAKSNLSVSPGFLLRRLSNGFQNCPPIGVRP
jgi:hypothetical protein